MEGNEDGRSFHTEQKRRTSPRRPLGENEDSKKKTAKRNIKIKKTLNESSRKKTKNLEMLNILKKILILFIFVLCNSKGVPDSNMMEAQFFFFLINFQIMKQ